MQVYKNYVGGFWKDSVSGELIQSVNPANGELVARAQKSTVDDVNEAVNAAQRAFFDTDWRHNPSKRARAMYKLADALRREAQRLAEYLTLENGKPIRDSINEVNRSADLCEYYAGLAKNIYGRTVAHSLESISLLIREPVGVVAIIIPWNAPIILLFRGLAPALAAGNSTITKPASYTLACMAEIFRLIDGIEEFPKGIANFVTGPGPIVGTELARSDKVNMVSLTGDVATGKEIMRLASSNLKKVSLELGGKSPNIVFADANLEKAIKGAITGACISQASQICFAGTRILIEEQIHDKFLRKIEEIMSKMKVGPGINPETEIGPVVSKIQMERILDYIEVGKKDSKLLFGGHRLAEGELAKGYFIAPTVFDHVPPDSKIAQEEIFGPVLSVLTFKDEEDAAKLANDTIYGLAAGIWTRDLSKAIRLSRLIQAGTVWVNTFCQLPPPAGRGGFKQSGMGKMYGLDGLYDFTELKHVLIDVGGT